MLTALAGGLLWNAEPINDVAWQLWVARQVLHGVGLYTDILEVNPPLWFWTAVPLAKLSELVGITAYHLLVICIVALEIAALALMRRLSCGVQSGALVVFLFPIITLFAFLDMFGQREQIVLISVTPYLALVSRRIHGLDSSRMMAITCGALAGFGIAMKPHFALVPLALEIPLLLCTRRLTIRLELITMATLLIGYVLSVVIFAPAFFTSNLPMLKAYQGWGNSISYQMRQPVIGMTFLLLLSLLLYGRPRSTIARGALALVIAFLIAYFLQGKGWRYHSIPAMGFLALAVVAEAECWCARLTSVSARASAALALLVLLCLVVPPVRSIWINDHANAQRATRDLRPGDVVAVLPGSGYWPIPEQRHLIWPLRHMVYWMLAYAPGVGSGKLNPIAEKSVVEGVRHVARDLICHPPRRILEDAGTANLRRTELIRFLSSDADFARLMQAYRRGPDYGQFATYDRVQAFPSPPAGCRPIY
ncbi:MAG TPA: hypothetical protein VF409_01430 [Sphingomonas sp.]